MRFTARIFPVFLLAAILLVIPILDIMTNRSLQPGLKQHVDIFCSFAGLIGAFLAGTMVSVHRRLNALENLVSTKNQQS